MPIYYFLILQLYFFIIVFDIFSKEKIPKCDVVIAADILYNEYLAKQVGKRCLEVLFDTNNNNNNPTKLIVTDSQKFHGTDFIKEIHNDSRFMNNDNDITLSWEEKILKNVTGSGILIDEDQTYDVKGRILRINRH